MTTSSPYEFFGPTLCVRGRWLYNEARLITESNYHYHVNKGGLNVVRPGKGRGNSALIEFESIYTSLKEVLIQVAPPPNALEYNLLRDLITPDNEAARYFATTYRKPDGSALKTSKQKEYLTNAIILNACQAFEKKHIIKKTRTWIWQQLSTALNNLEGYEHSLPSNPRSLQRVSDKYRDGGYKALVHGGEGNSNSRKVNDKLESLILSIYTMKNKPFSKSVQQIYLQFLGGAINIVDTTTGELFDPADFTKDGQPITISEQTVWNYLNDPKNRIIVDKYRSGSLEFNNTHRPHHHRHAPNFSLSKISLDDRDLPRKMHDGKRVKAYYAYDVVSGCVIGASYSKDKDQKLFIDCIRDMLLFLKQESLGVPMEMEVEHHIVNLFKNDLMKAGTCFPFVRWCAAGNSQEKRAEHFNKAKKYGYEKRYQDGIGRWYAKSEAHRTVVEKVFDSENDNYKEKRFDYDFLVADDREVINKYNNDLHPNQKKFKGMTRMQVLLQNVNPKCAQFDEVVWARYVGNHTTTTIRRSQYMRVQYADYQLPSVEYLDLLSTNNREVDAYYIPSPNGNIESIYIYQNDQFICECRKIEKYNEASAEHTSNDKLLIGMQSQFVKSFDDKVKAGKSKIAKLELLQPFTSQPVPKELPAVLNDKVEDVDYEVEDEFAALLANRDENEIKNTAKNRI